MIKKILAVMLALLMMLSFAACKANVDLDAKKSEAEEKILEGTTEAKDVIDEGLDKSLEIIDENSDDIDDAVDKIKDKLDELSKDGFFF